MSSTYWRILQNVQPYYTLIGFFLVFFFWTDAYLIPLWGEGGRLLEPLLASATVRDRLAPVSQPPFLFTGWWYEQVGVRLGEATSQLQVARRAHPNSRSYSCPRVPGLLVHSGVNRFWITVCQDGGHAGSARRTWSSWWLLSSLGGFLFFGLALVWWQNTWKPKGVLTAIDDGRGSVQETSELLWDTCSWLLACLGVL